MSTTVLPSVEDFGDADYRAFEQRAQTKFGVRLQDYKSDQMKRRLTTLARRTGSRSFMEYVLKLDRDSVQLQAFLDEVTINVTELLRNPQLFEQFAREILPKLQAIPRATPLSVWSAGCSYGAEAYSMAILLHEYDSKVPFRIHGTDVDLSVLTKANTASFIEADMRNVSPERRQTHFHQIIEGRFSPALHLKRNVSFSRHDLLADSYGREAYDVICCRNVLIYFTEEAKTRIFKGFVSALRPGGILFIGGSERLANHQEFGLEVVCPFFYRKPLGR